ncbi:MAG: response regulator [Promethearchaeota archaeon]|nr:MAG: response regulator [Candidatus Lokiarchaeota archaeon]
MKPFILVVEDNVDLLFNLDLILKSNDYRTLLAKNGIDAIEKLEKANQQPDIIISDILMPKMNGYEFFQHISNDPRWSSIPFIFLTARAAQKEVRLGKLLGADDYITKPFEEKDLLAAISGRLNRIQRIEKINEKLLNLNHRNYEIKKEQTCLILVIWDDKVGPELRDYYPKTKDFHIPLENIGSQLFSAATTIYGHDAIDKAEGLLINIKNYNLYGYVFFDSFSVEHERSEQKQYMIAYLSPFLSYLHSLKINAIFKDFSKKIKKNDKWNIKRYWLMISQSLNEIDLIDQ